MSPDNDLERLRTLLLKDEQQAVAELKQRLSNRYQRTQDISEVLCDALRLTERQENSELVDTLRMPVEDAVQASLKRDPHHFAEILYPAILPAIRRSIAESLRQYLEHIDTLVTRNFSLRSVQWRIQSWRTGVPLSDIVLRHTIVYQVEQLLLIQNSSGLLLQHVHDDLALDADSDAVTGMLWAIESFVRDSFSDDKAQGLNRVTMGAHTIYLVHGPAATLACVIKGVASPEYLDRAREILEKIHAQKASQIRRFNGDRSLFSATRPILAQGLETVYRRKALSKTKKWSFILLPGLAVLALVFVIVSSQLERYRVQQLTAELADMPGIFVGRVDHLNGVWQVRGLADPSSADPGVLLAKHSLKPAQIQFKFSPYLSLEPEVIEKRLLHELRIPDTVGFNLLEGVAQLSGEAPVDWFRSMVNRAALPVGVSALDFSEISLSADAVIAHLRSTLPLPGSVSVRASGDVVEITGSATHAWVQSLDDYVLPLNEFIGFERSRLRSVATDDPKEVTN